MGGQAIPAAHDGPAQKWRPQQPRPHYCLAPRRRQQTPLQICALHLQHTTFFPTSQPCLQYMCVNTYQTHGGGHTNEVFLCVSLGAWQSLILASWKFRPVPVLCYLCRERPAEGFLVKHVLSLLVCADAEDTCRLQVDFSRRHEGEVGVVERLEYDPNRTARIALVKYGEGQCCHLFILA